MKFKQYLTEICDLDKTLKGITKPNNVTWVFFINDTKFRMYVTTLGVKVGQEWYRGIEVMLESYNTDKGKWVIDHFKSSINAGVLCGKIVSVMYDIINTHKPKVFTLRAYNNNITKLYDIVWGKPHNSKPFVNYTKYKNTVSGISQYSFVEGPNLQEDEYMMDNYMDMMI
jgi:hypothetical protein